jgi:hypothetical protein
MAENLTRLAQTIAGMQTQDYEAGAARVVKSNEQMVQSGQGVEESRKKLDRQQVVGLNTIERLERQVDKAYAAEKRFQSQLETVHTAFQQGTIDVDRHADLVDKVTRHYESTTVAVRNNSAALTQSKTVFNQLGSEIDTALGGLAGRAGVLGRVLAGFGPAGIVVGAAIGGFSYLRVKASEAAGAIADASDRLGIGAAKLLEFRFNAISAGQSVEQFETAFASFSTTLGQALRGSDEAERKFLTLGIAIRDAATGKGRNPEAVYRDLADAIAAAGSQAQRSAVAAEFFGEKAGSRMAAALAQGSAGLDASRSKLRAWGVDIDDQMIGRIKQLDNDFKLLGVASQAWMIQAADAAPVLAGRMFGPYLDYAERVGRVLAYLATLGRYGGTEAPDKPAPFPDINAPIADAPPPVFDYPRPPPGQTQGQKQAAQQLIRELTEQADAFNLGTIAQAKFRLEREIDVEATKKAGFEIRKYTDSQVGDIIVQHQRIELLKQLQAVRQQFVASLRSDPVTDQFDNFEETRSATGEKDRKAEAIVNTLKQQRLAQDEVIDATARARIVFNSLTGEFEIYNREAEIAARTWQILNQNTAIGIDRARQIATEEAQQADSLKRVNDGLQVQINLRRQVLAMRQENLKTFRGDPTTEQFEDLEGNDARLKEQNRKGEQLAKTLVLQGRAQDEVNEATGRAKVVFNEITLQYELYNREAEVAARVQQMMNQDALIGIDRAKAIANAEADRAEGLKRLTDLQRERVAFVNRQAQEEIRIWEHSAEQIQDAMRDRLRDTFRGEKGRSIKETALDFAADLAASISAAMIIKPTIALAFEAVGAPAAVLRQMGIASGLPGGDGGMLGNAASGASWLQRLLGGGQTAAGAGLDSLNLGGGFLTQGVPSYDLLNIDLAAQFGGLGDAADSLFAIGGGLADATDIFGTAIAGATDGVTGLAFAADALAASAGADAALFAGIGAAMPYLLPALAVAAIVLPKLLGGKPSVGPGGSAIIGVNAGGVSLSATTADNGFNPASLSSGVLQVGELLQRLAAQIDGTLNQTNIGIDQVAQGAGGGFRWWANTARALIEGHAGSFDEAGQAAILTALRTGAVTSANENVNLALKNSRAGDLAGLLSDVEFVKGLDHLGETLTAVQQQVKAINDNADAIAARTRALGVATDQVEAARTRQLARMADDYARNVEDAALQIEDPLELRRRQESRLHEQTLKDLEEFHRDAAAEERRHQAVLRKIDEEANSQAEQSARAVNDNASRLRDTALSLALGGDSSLSTQQKVQLAGGEFFGAAQTALSSGSTAEERAAAIDRLNSIGPDYQRLGRQYYASGEGSTAIFDTIQDVFRRVAQQANPREIVTAINAGSLQQATDMSRLIGVMNQILGVLGETNALTAEQRNRMATFAAGIDPGLPRVAL